MGMRIGTEMPRLEGATEWLGGTQAHAEMEAKGHPTLVHFWSMSCGICKENMPRIAEWRDGLKEQALRVVAVQFAPGAVGLVRDARDEFESLLGVHAYLRKWKNGAGTVRRRSRHRAR